MHGTTTRRRSGRRLLVLAAAFAAATLVLAGSASGTGKYTDASGDNGSAPDVTGATVDSGPNGQLVFRIGITNLPASGDVQAVLLVDSDANPATGRLDMGGVDYVFVSDRSDHTWGFAHWTGSSWDWNTPWSTAAVLAFSNALVVTVNRSELSNTSQLNFGVVTVTGDGGSGNVDLAPDLGLWNYDLQAQGPDIKGIQVATKPSVPKARKTFAVTVTGLQLTPTGNPLASAQPESYSCTAKLAGRALAGSGQGGCTFKLPKKARGKTLVVAVTVEYQGATKTVEFPFKVK